MPQIYQPSLSLLLNYIKKEFDVSSLSYSNDKNADINIKSYGFLDRFQRILYKLKLSKFESKDHKEMCKYDIVHLQHSFLFRKVLMFLKVSKENRPKIIITLRGADTYLKPWVDVKWSFFYREQSHLINAFVTVSNHQKEYLLKWGIPKHKIFVIPPSFGSSSNSSAKYPNKEKLKIVSAFRMVWEKNIDKCLRFAKVLKEKGVNFSYDIYGSGQAYSQLFFLIDKYDLVGFVNPMGVIENKILKTKLRDYDFFLQLSLSESFGVSIVEAQSYGVPCIVSSAGGIPEALENNKSGIIDYEENLELLAVRCLEIWNDKEKYKQYSQHGINFVNANYSIDKEVSKYISLYKNLTVE